MLRMNTRTRIRNVNGKRKVVTAGAGSQSMSTSGGASGFPVNRAAGGGASTKDTLLDGILKQDPDTLRSVYLDLYLHDAISGGAADLMSMLPWSDYSLSGGDAEQLKVFYDSMERFNVVELMPEASLDHNVLGAFIGTGIYSHELKGFSDLMPHSIASCTIEETPIYSADPKITLKVPDEMKNFAKSNDPHMRKIQQRLGSHIVESMKMNEVTLDPLTTFYCPRSSFSTVQTGLSMFHRVLPIYLLERLLYRGTLTEAARRQKSILHIMAGDDVWEPDSEELTQLVGLFQQAELDPISAIVATQQNVTTNELRQGGDFWKWTDVIPETSDMKMKALGINEAFLSGDATFNTMEVALSVFIEQMRTFRDTMTRKIFYSKMFPILSVVHGFESKTMKQVEQASVHRNRRHAEFASSSLTKDFNFKINDKNSLLIPQINWHKQLKPEADREYLELLETMSEKGVPVSLRMWAAAGGMDLDTAMEGIEEDKKTREEIAKLSGVPQGEAGGGDEDEDFGDDFSFASMAKRGKKTSKSLLSREWGDSGEVIGRTKTGKKKYIHNQKAAHQKQNDNIIKAIRENSDGNRYLTTVSKAKRLKLIR